jgi:dinuclear metal center YbgI/SA1388 family protein
MPALAEVCRFLEAFAPLHLAEEWDNVGLLVGDRSRSAARIMTCLTITGDTADEAIAERCDLIVTHHPMPFRPLKRLTTETTPGRLLLSLAENRIAIYSPHTSFDSTSQGINEQLALGLGLSNVRPLVPLPGGADTAFGSGRVGDFPEPLSLKEVGERLKRFLKTVQLQVVGEASSKVARAAVACGSAGQFLEPAHRAGCQLLVTGETTFHTCLEAQALGVALLLPGHYASERFAVETLAEQIAAEFVDAHVWASRRESDPLGWV